MATNQHEHPDPVGSAQGRLVQQGTQTSGRQGSYSAPDSVMSLPRRPFRPCSRMFWGCSAMFWGCSAMFRGCSGDVPGLFGDVLI